MTCKRTETNHPRQNRREAGKQGDELSVEAIEQGVVFKRIPRIEDCTGIFAGHADVAELKKEIDKLREEY